MVDSYLQPESKVTSLIARQIVVDGEKKRVTDEKRKEGKRRFPVETSEFNNHPLFVHQPENDIL